MIRILFIDEEKETLEDFAEYVEKSTTKVPLEIFTELPLESEEEMIEEIFKINPDAIITDYRLNEMKEDIKYNVPYNGVDLVESFQEIRDGFPCFVLTAMDDEAVSQSEDVNIVYIKNIIYKPDEVNARANFLDRVISQVEHYKSKILNAEAELNGLIKLRESGKTKISDEERIIELDHFLEKSINKQSAIPIEYKSLSNTNKLGEILNKVDELIQKVEGKNGK